MYMLMIDGKAPNEVTLFGETSLDKFLSHRVLIQLWVSRYPYMWRRYGFGKTHGSNQWIDAINTDMGQLDKYGTFMELGK